MKKRRTSALRPVHSAGTTCFAAVVTRYRQDGWTPERQRGFIEALAECGCVDEACQRVGMGTSSAYALRRRAEARSFRQAWDAAIDMAIERLSDAAFARALKGVATPVFYKGEQVGERVRHDERLTMFLLRYRDPLRYGAWIDGCRAERAPDGAAAALASGLESLAAEAAGGRMAKRRAGPATRYVSPRAQAIADDRAEAKRRAAETRSARATEAETDAAILRKIAAIRARRDPGADMACGSSTSDAGNRDPSGSTGVAGSRAPP